MRALLIAGLTTGMLSAAPVPKFAAEKPRAWKPTAGTRIVYAFSTRRDYERTVGDAAAAADGYSFTLVGSKASHRQRLTVGDATTRDVTDTSDIGREIGYYRPGMKVGDTFDATGENGPPGDVVTYHVEAEDEVRVLAGRFKAFRIRVTVGEHYARTYWVNYRVGIVRVTEASGETQVELKSYTPGK